MKFGSAQYVRLMHLNIYIQDNICDKHEACGDCPLRCTNPIDNEAPSGGSCSLIPLVELLRDFAEDHKKTLEMMDKVYGTTNGRDIKA